MTKEIEINEKPKHCLMNITPAMASAMLKKTEMLGITNRRINQKWVTRFAKIMAEHGWMLNGETIVLDKDGGVIDGQHRLHACIKANTPFATSVIKNIDRKTFTTINCGHSRNAAQALQIEGVKYNTQIASIIHGVHLIRNNTFKNVELIPMTNTEVTEEYHEHAEMYQRIITTVYPLTHANRMLTPRTAGSVMYYLINDLGYDWDSVESFITGAISEDTHPDEYVNALRKWLFRNAKTNIRESIKYCNVVLAWNAMVKQTKIPKFKDTFDEIPTFVQV